MKHNLLMASIVAAISIASVAAPTTPTPTSKKLGYNITVPVIFQGKNVGSTVISKGESVEVISETETTITIRHMGQVLTIPKPGTAKTAATPTPPNVPAKVVTPGNKPIATSGLALEEMEIDRIAKFGKRPLPYPVLCFEIESDGTYAFAGQTCNPNGDVFEHINGKLKLAHGGRLWEINDTDTIAAKVINNPKLAKYIQKWIPETGYKTYEEYLKVYTEKGARIAIAQSKYAIPKNTPLQEVLKMIAKRDPRTQSLRDATCEESPFSIQWKFAPTSIERVGIETIATELQTSKATSQTVVSMRNDVEKTGVKHRRQIGDTCTIYSAYHLLDYYMRKGIIKPFSFEQFQAMVSSQQNGVRASITRNTLLKILATTQPHLKIRVREMYRFGYNQTDFYRQGCDQIFRLHLQHEIECGRPIWASVQAHQVMAVGYESPQNQTGIGKLLALDSTGYGDKDKGYSIWDMDEVTRFISFEFIK